MENKKATIDDANILAELCMGVHRLHIELQPMIFRQPSHQGLTDFFRERIPNPEYKCFLAWDSDKPVAYAALHIIRRPVDVFTQARNYVEIYHVYTTEKYRKRGICKLLFSKALEVAWSLNIGKVQLGVFEQNAAAVAAFTALGFNQQWSIMTLESSEKLKPFFAQDAKKPASVKM
jgi:GNAT superfamily N-acetyltransferase